MSGHTVPHLLSDHSRSSITPPTPPYPTRSAEWDNAAMVLVSLFSASTTCFFLFDMMFMTSPTMLRRLVAKEWPSIVITLGISWAYAITALSIKPHYIHGLWLLFFRVVTPTWLYALDAHAVYTHLRLDPKALGFFLLPRKWCTRGGSRKHNSWLILFMFSTLFLPLAMDIARHYLLVQLSKDVNLVTLNVTNPFNNRPVTFNNVDLATALFWGATIFMTQSMWLVLTKKVFQETITDITRYEIILETSERRKTRVHR